MKHTTPILTIIVIFITALSSCHKDVPLYTDKNYKGTLVVYSVCAPNEPIKVKVSTTSLPKQLDSTAFVTNATVTVTDNTGTKTTLKHSKNGEYYSDFKTNKDQEYAITVEYNNQKTTGKIIFPTTPNPIEIKIADKISATTTFENESEYAQITSNINFEAIITDKPEKQYYMLYFFSKSSDFYAHVDTITDTVTYHILRTYLSPNYFTLEGGMTDYRYISGILPFNDTTISFYGSTYIFNDDFFSGNSFKFSSQINATPTIKKTNLKDIKLYYRFVNISEDLFKYFSSITKYQNSNSNPLVEPVNIFSNVEGGFGLITGYNQIIDSLTYDIEQLTEEPSEPTDPDN